MHPRLLGRHPFCGWLVPLSTPAHRPYMPARPAAPAPLAAVKRGAKAIDLKKIADAGCNIAKDQGFNVSLALMPRLWAAS